MRFSANQLRMLQEDLAPALPQLAPPPEMVQMPLPAPEAGPQSAHSRLACSALAPAYVVASAAALAGLPLSFLPVPVLLTIHALAAAHSRPAQVAGLCAAASLQAACASPSFLPAAGLLASVFFSCAGVGGGLSRVALIALTPLAVALAALAAIAQAGQARDAALCALLASLCAQAALSSARLGTFEVICGPAAR
jgi:hypothetical protein